VVTVLLPLLAALLVYLGFAIHWLWLWPGAVLVAAWIVYLLRAPQAFMKRDDGTLSPLSYVLWAPLFAYTWSLQGLIRVASREPLATEVAPGIWVGRRPRARELPAGTVIVVDLCAEFPAARGVPTGRTYLAIPTLDARAPKPAQIASAVDAVLAASGPAFIHCAHGHGRSATVAAAVLVRRGEATLDDVEQKMKAKRPRIGLNVHQRTALALASSRR
jgi:protein-tyrosine phosphatase